MTDINSLIHDGTIWLLVTFSIVTWVLIVVKVVQTQKASKQSKVFVEAFWKAKNLPEAVTQSQQGEGPTARVANAGFQTLIEADEKTHQDLQNSWSRQDLLERHLRKQILTERRQLEKGSALLASIGNNAPFIGLFGTVFGIIHALQAIAHSGNASMDVVAGPIGEALIATGIGIAVAVPAVLAYNYFIRKVKTIGADLDDFATDFVSLNQKAGFQLPVAKPKNTTGNTVVNHDASSKEVKEKRSVCIMAVSTSQEDDVVSEINITPLVDVMLVLLIVFIVTAPLLTNTVKVNLPKAAPTQSTDQNKAVVISVNPQGEIFLDKDKVTLASFEKEIQSRKNSNPKLALNLNADETIPYGTVAKLLASIERVGVEKLSVITVPK